MINPVPRPARADCSTNSCSDNQHVTLVNDHEIADTNFVRAIREFVGAMPISPTEWIETPHDLYRDLEACIVDDQDRCVELDMTPLDIDPGEADSFVACPRQETLRDWYRGLCRPIRANAKPYVRSEARERFRLLATLIIAWNPQINWPRSIPANSNYAASNDN